MPAFSGQLFIDVREGGPTLTDELPAQGVLLELDRPFHLELCALFVRHGRTANMDHDVAQRVMRAAAGSEFVAPGGPWPHTAALKRLGERQ